MTVSNVFEAIGVTLQVVALFSDKQRALILNFAWITAFALKGRL